MEVNKIYQGEAKKVLSNMPNNSINTCVTSPPYWGLRDYGVEGQLGLESTPEKYVNKLVEIFTEVKRVLRDDGTLWLNLGDTYSATRWSDTPSTTGISDSASDVVTEKKTSLPDKNLVGIPWRVAFALQEDGWYLRNDLIWHKPNPMPESVTDRCTTSHEYIFLLAKNKKYYFNQNAIKEKATGRSCGNKNYKYEDLEGHETKQGITDVADKKWNKKNKRDVWKIATKPFSEAHFAVYPPDLIRPCVKAGCPDDGIVLDPFMGAGTTALVALQENKNFVGIELNQEYIDIAYERIGKIDKKYYKKIPKDKRPKQKQLF